ncbi:MAG: flagellar export protein FliJ [Gammaproteobacteria bacterium]|jgi:flagellar export protein FliJ
MAKDRNPLDMARMLADIAEFEKSKTVAAAMLNLSAEEERLATLERYLEEYRNSSGPGTGGISVGLLRSRHEFIETLAQAVEDQSYRVESLRDRIAQDVSDWRDAKAKVGALDKFLERRLEKEKERRNRREQARLDETSTLRHL